MRFAVVANVNRSEIEFDVVDHFEGAGLARRDIMLDMGQSEDGLFQEAVEFLFSALNFKGVPNELVGFLGIGVGIPRGFRPTELEKLSLSLTRFRSMVPIRLCLSSLSSCLANLRSISGLEYASSP